MIEQASQTASTQSQDKAVAFISYAREHGVFATRLDESLRLAGIDVQGDWRLLRGEDFKLRLRAFILGSDAFLFVVSPDSITSAPCREELSTAIALHKLILPVIRQECDEAFLRANLNAEQYEAIAKPNWTFIREKDDFVSGVQALVEAINTDFELMPEHRNLQAAAENWDHNGRNSSYLIRKEGLRKAEQWLARTGLHPHKLPKPTSLQSEYLLASQRAQSRSVRIAFTLATIIALALAFLSLAAVAQTLQASDNAEEAVSNYISADLQRWFAEENQREATRQEDQAQRQRLEANRERDNATVQESIARDREQEARRQKGIAETQKGIAVTERDHAIDQTKLANDRLRLKAYVSARDASDWPAALIAIRDFETDGRIEGWKNAAVDVLQHPVPVWQSDEDVLSVDAANRRFISLTTSRKLIVRSFDAPQRPIELQGAESVIASGLNLSILRFSWSGSGNYLSVYLNGSHYIWSLSYPLKPVLTFDTSDVVFSPRSDLAAVAVENAIEFWRLGEKPVREGRQEIVGVVLDIEWMRERERVLVHVRPENERRGSEGELFEVGPKEKIKLAHGFKFYDFTWSPWRQLITKQYIAGTEPLVRYEVKSLERPDKPVFNLTLKQEDASDYQRDGIHLFTCGEEGRFALLRAKDKLWLGDTENPTAAPVEIMTFTGSPLTDNTFLIPASDGNKLLVAEEGLKKIYLFDLAEPSQVKSLDSFSGVKQKNLTLSPKGDWLIDSGELFDLVNFKSYPFPSGPLLGFYEIEQINFSPDGKRFAAHITDTSRIILIDFEHPTQLRTISQAGMNHPGAGFRIDWGEAGAEEMLIASSEVLSLWRLSEQSQTIVGDNSDLVPYVVSANGDFAVMAGNSFGSGQLQLWRVNPLQKLGALNFEEFIEQVAVNASQSAMVTTIRHSDDVLGNNHMEIEYRALSGTEEPRLLKTRGDEADQPAFLFKSANVSRDSLRVLTTSKDGKPLIWEPPFEQPLSEIPVNKSFGTGYLSSSGNFAALLFTSFNHKTAEVWNLSNARQPVQVDSYDVPEFYNETFNLAVSNDGSKVIAFGKGNCVLLSKGGPRELPLPGSDNRTKQVEFSPSGKQIIATFYDGRAVVWNLDKPEQPQLVMERFSSTLWLARFGETDNQVISGTSNGQLRVWDISTQGLRQALNKFSNLCLTPQQSQNYFGGLGFASANKSRGCAGTPY